MELRQNPYGSQRNNGGPFEGFLLDIKDPHRMDENKRFKIWEDREKDSSRHSNRTLSPRPSMFTKSGM